MGIVQYGERVVHEFRLSDFRTVDEVVAAAKNIEQRGGEETRTALGINVARYGIAVNVLMLMFFLYIFVLKRLLASITESVCS